MKKNKGKHALDLLFLIGFIALGFATTWLIAIIIAYMMIISMIIATIASKFY